ncbi:MAG: anti-sigma factor [Bacteroidota bacterium]
MNVQEYISSGIIESYVLGLASSEERKEFEMMCAQYPEVLQARIAFELALENEAMQNAIEPTAGLKEKTWNQIQSARVVTMSSKPIRTINWFKYAVAACLILLAGSLYWNVSLYTKNKKLQNDFDGTVAKLNTMENDARILQQNPNIKMAAMTGMEISPQSFATVYWDTTSKDVYLLVNNLPKPASNKQYQLWALLDGKPIDGGVIDNGLFDNQSKLLIRMKEMKHAQAFAITLEKVGGNPTPEGAMYVMGKL